ncbi:MAG TPA: hypothetical protein ENJ51_11690 [Leucothrix mucor]|uniref:PEP-utilising enzyme mobile domain-containing protein n=1 Tax=Leucothrix mucor TaxID=45248 RepID=A0A7V2T512_LEUMU|nr:hypothetical protein [Leucothrix mucor]
MTHLSKKYAYLAQAEKAGIITPKTLLLEDINDDNIQHFIADCDEESRFIVRSIQSAEDTHQQSYAGHFWSSLAISADAIIATILQAKKENHQRLKQLHINEVPQLMLQEYIEHNIGGVLFSPWSFFANYCFIEYSTHSVQDAVEGKTSPAVISLKENIQSPLALAEKVKFLEPPLRLLTQQLQGVFDFPIDSEWVYSEKKQTLILLQVRPQTHLVGAVLNATPELQQQIKLPEGDWQYTALSESLGKLSPLSFSLLEQLYEDAKASLQSLGYQAKHIDFMTRLPDGCILVEPRLEKAFYSPTRFGGFWKSFKTPQWQQKIKQLFATLTLDSHFSYSKLSQYFQYWMVANTLSNGQGRAENTAHAYELSWQQNVSKPITDPSSSSWGAFNQQLKTLFFFELEKLKQQLAPIPENNLLSWQDYQCNKVVSKAQEQEATTGALYDYSLLGAGESTSTLQSIGAKKKISGKLFFIENPSRFQQKIPTGSILIAPYFDNQWVQSIPTLNGIIVQQGGHLSHSAIVARESGIPYFVGKQEDNNAFQQGDWVTLSLSGVLSQSRPK